MDKDGKRIRSDKKAIYTCPRIPKDRYRSEIFVHHRKDMDGRVCKKNDTHHN